VTAATKHTALKTHTHQAMLSTTVVSTGLLAALANLDVALAGWPTSTPGAGPQETLPTSPCRDEQCTHIRPCPIHDKDRDHLNILEQAALNGDSVRIDLADLERDIRAMAHHAARASRIVTRWAHRGLTDTEIRQQLVAVDASIWCKNCSRYGRHEPRAQDLTECDFCSRFRRDYKVACPREIWDARDARGGRIDLTTIDRILKRVKQERAEAKKAAEKAKKRAAVA
jgi:hypothetical protein